jgi:hypothetical protein
MGRYNCSNTGKLKPWALVDYTKYNSDSAIPAMNVTIYAPSSSLPKMQMLKATHRRLNKNNHACSQ